MRTPRSLRRVVATAAVALLATTALAACGDDDDSASDTTTTSKAAPEKLEILVTNDDGIGAAGIDTLVESLRSVADAKLTVVAPAENQSGKGDSTTDPPPSASAGKTASGFEGTAVNGTPADSVNYAIDTMKLTPDLVVSGTNNGQNIGPLTDISGTVGAALTAARTGIPAVAVSQGLGDPPAYDSSVAAALEWINDHRAEILAGDAPVNVTNINAPTCKSGEIRGRVEVPVATELNDGATNPNCESTATDPKNDVDAFGTGYISISVIEP